MTRGEAQTLVNRYVRLVHAGPDYVQEHDLEGVVVEVTDSQLYMTNPRKPQDEPRGWHLAPISKARTVRDAIIGADGDS